jgi:HEAT repeat protein
LPQIQGAEAKEALAVLVEALADDDPSVRESAAIGLVVFRSEGKDAVPALTKMLKDPAAVPRRAAAVALLHIQGAEAKDAAAVLSEALKDPEWEVRHGIATTLGEIGSAAIETLPALRAALKDEDVWIRRTAARAITQIDPEQPGEAIGVLAQALEEKDPGIRAYFIEILSGLGPVAKDAAGALTKLLDDEVISVRRSAAIALLRVQGAEAKGAAAIVNDALAEPDATLREGYVWLTAELGTAGKEVLPALTKLLKDESVAIRRAAAYATAKVAGLGENKDAQATLVEALSDPDPVTRYSYLVRLGSFSPPAPGNIIEAVKKATKDEVDYVRFQAEETLKNLQKE